MAEVPFFSSQGSQYEQHQILPQEQENVASSPPPAPTSRKLKKPPPITPKRFTKFFTPRNTKSGSCKGGRQSKAGRQLRDITRNAVNRRIATEREGLGKCELQDEELSSRPSKRRKQSFGLDSSPPQSSPLKHVSFNPVHVFEDYDDAASLPELLEELQPFPKPIRRVKDHGGSRRILQRSFGGYDGLARGRRGDDHCADWQPSTANFYTTPNDIHPFPTTALPFCTASCTTNPLVAIGDEEGAVRVLDPSDDFTKQHVAFRPHHNAVMDLAFSSNDYLLATASGDQTTRIVDMRTQQTRLILSGHTSSVKQVRWQPGNDSMLATSSRDGSVQIWDLRSHRNIFVQSLHVPFETRKDIQPQGEEVLYSKSTLAVGKSYSTGYDRNDISITAISYLPNGREHLLLTSSEANAAVKLWDLRQTSRRTPPTPVSSTQQPPNHNKSRHYGVNAMCLSGDGGRLYTVCRDSTVYAYSTNHLVLGLAPEMAGGRRVTRETKSGLGPLYGFRHPSFHAATFYVKASLRPATADKTEMLAVGSSDGCAVLFPTDENYHSRRNHPQSDADFKDDEDDLPTALPRLGAKPGDLFPVYEQGIALAQGHRKEVTSLVWTHDGELVTLGDDFTARRWREDSGEIARGLRLGGEGEGKRWGCGWAEVSAGYDEDE